MTPRRFNERGIKQFELILESLRQGQSVETPLDILTSDETSEVVSQTEDIDVNIFHSRFELAAFVDKVLASTGIADEMNDIGLWSWLGAVFLDSTCPAEADGRRKPGNSYRHSPSNNWRDFYRHLIRGPVRIFRLFKENPEAASIVLCQKPQSPGDFVEQLASRQERITNPAIIETANRLYYDTSTGSPKRGASPNWRKPGTLRRFGDVLDQLDLTYDLYSMSTDQLTSLLPSEFAPYSKT